jgi:hypothetical protein
VKIPLLLLVGAAVACQPRANPDPVTTSPDTASVTVAQVIDSASLVGRTVSVTGRCLGYQVPAVAIGPPPLTRSDWQLEDGGVAVFVSGAYPAGCSATAGSTTPTTVVALVAQDTLPALGNRPATARRYLVRK